MLMNEVLAQLSAGKIDLATAQVLIAAAAKKDAKPAAWLTFKVSAKGALSVYGLGRWPTTLYRSQWNRLIEKIKAGHLEKFMADHATDLKDKGDDDAKPEAPAVSKPGDDFGGKEVAA